MGTKIDNQRRMKLEEVGNILYALLKRTAQPELRTNPEKPPQSLYMAGAPGIGKTETVHQIAAQFEEDMEAKTGEEWNVIVNDFSLPLHDPVDLKGLGYVEEENGKNVTRWSYPKDIIQSSGREEEPNTVYILFFDDLPNAPTTLQGVVYNAFKGHQLGPHKIPDNTLVVGAGNRAEDKSVVHQMPAALTNRVMYANVRADEEDWITWAMKEDFHPIIPAFIKRNGKQMLMGEPRQDGPWPSPRAWENMWNFMRPRVERDGLQGFTEDLVSCFLGAEVASKFDTFMKYQHVIDMVDEIEPGNLPATGNRVQNLSMDEQYVLAMTAVQNVDDMGTLYDWLLNWETNTDIACFAGTLGFKVHGKEAKNAAKERRDRLREKWGNVVQAQRK